jgi:hypothetical protein
MTTVEQKLITLTDQVAELTEQIRQLRVRAIYADALFDTGYRAGQDALLSRARRSSEHRHRSGHLRPVGDDGS